MPETKAPAQVERSVTASSPRTERAGSAPAPAPADAPEPLLSKAEPLHGDTTTRAAGRRPAQTEIAKVEAPSGLPAVETAAGSTDVAAAANKEASGRVAELAKGARHTSTGASSLTRALGLKLNRIVLDAGHGGHDQGTTGPKGLLEKDLVLDVTLRLGKLIEQGLGAEVIYTRSDDTFVPLEGRTALANEKKADLFLSIHANSSPYSRITGVETYYLNFTDSREAMDLAARENAASSALHFRIAGPASQDHDARKAGRIA